MIFEQRKKRLLALCDNVLKGSDQEIPDKIERFLLSLNKPKTFSGPDSYEIMFDRNFEEVCHSLSNHSGGRNVKKMTVLEVYTLIEIIKKNQKNGGG